MASASTSAIKVAHHIESSAFKLSKSLEASAFKIGHRIEGGLSSYVLSAQLHKDVWTAESSRLGRVIIKTAPRFRLDTERKVLTRFRAQPGIRQLLDETHDPPTLVLKYLDDNLLSASNSKTLEKAEIKFIAKNILKALQALHEAGYVHTDIKPDNILINYGFGDRRIKEVELGDCGDTWQVDPKDHLKVGQDGHVIGAHMFRSPEAMLNLRWGTPTDIWSFGTTLISLIGGLDWHIFKPDFEDAKVGEEGYAEHVLIKQISYFGPFPSKYEDVLPEEDERWQFLAIATKYIIENEKWKPFELAEDEEFTAEDRTFLCKIMKLDPRDRPTAAELLEDEWLKGV